MYCRCKVEEAQEAGETPAVLNAGGTPAVPSSRGWRNFDRLKYYITSELALLDCELVKNFLIADQFFILSSLLILIGSIRLQHAQFHIIHKEQV
jgi:hypothetical protein